MTFTDQSPRVPEVLSCPTCATGSLDSRSPDAKGMVRCGACGAQAFSGYVAEAAKLVGYRSQVQRRLDWLTQQIRSGAPAPYGPPPAPGLPQPTKPVAVAAPVEGASILLGLGTALLVIAAIVFVAVVWTRIGALGQATVLTSLFLGIAALAVRLRRRLPATAEALAVTSLGILTTELLAAPHLGLVSIDEPSWGGWWPAFAWTVVGLVGIGAGLAYGLRAWTALGWLSATPATGFLALAFTRHTDWAQPRPDLGSRCGGCDRVAGWSCSAVPPSSGGPRLSGFIVLAGIVVLDPDGGDRRRRPSRLARRRDRRPDRAGCPPGFPGHRAELADSLEPGLRCHCRTERLARGPAARRDTARLGGRRGPARRGRSRGWCTSWARACPAMSRPRRCGCRGSWVERCRRSRSAAALSRFRWCVVLGAAAAVLLVDARLGRRPELAWTGAAVGIGATAVAMAHLQTGAVEAYSLPAAALLLTAGLVWKAQRVASTWVWCAPAVAVALIPSALVTWTSWTTPESADHLARVGAVLAVSGALTVLGSKLKWPGMLVPAASAFTIAALAGITDAAEHVGVLEVFTLPTAALLLAGGLLLRRFVPCGSLVWCGPAATMALIPSALATWSDWTTPESSGHLIRLALVLVAGAVLVALGVRLRWAGLLIPGAVGFSIAAMAGITDAAQHVGVLEVFTLPTAALLLAGGLLLRRFVPCGSLVWCGPP